ncbi:hypothetical protein Lfu02_77930 [Longispora fulva]|uniref:Uncharacterized protein n=1 Tax=Longispora fulva TaxID=619741 RepID=A0A8J7GCS2_9ACTN|nr:hypothetical protein [Longispora fulva]MBG6136239.1 hypothetical protein [Longispora fulva]GIG63421.1 hypothetical protein Lfu02_77930 [Longispora fulva]
MTDVSALLASLLARPIGAVTHDDPKTVRGWVANKQDNNTAMSLGNLARGIAWAILLPAPLAVDSILMLFYKLEVTGPFDGLILGLIILMMMLYLIRASFAHYMTDEQMDNAGPIRRLLMRPGHVDLPFGVTVIGGLWILAIWS